MAILSDAIHALDPAPDKKTQLTLSLNLISELAEGKVKEFANEVENNHRTAGTTENRTIPISFVVAQHSEYRAYVKEDAGKIATEVSTAIQDFITGGSDKIVSGIAKLVTTGLSAILGTGQATQQEMRSYFVVAQSASIARYDIMAWRRTIEAEGITTKIEKCMAIYASKASVDISALDFNTFLIAYEEQLYKMKFSDEQLKEYIDYAEEIYKRLKRDSEPIYQGLTNFKPARNLLIDISTSNKPMRPGELVFYPDLLL
jgi:hypothetical protein